MHLSLVIVLFLSLTCLNGWAKQEEVQETQCGTAIAEKAPRSYLSPEFRMLVRERMNAMLVDAETVGQAIGVSRALIHKILKKPRTTLSEPTLERLATYLEIKDSTEFESTLSYRLPPPPAWDYDSLPSKIVLNENFLALARTHRMGLNFRQEDLAERMGVSTPYIQHLLKGKIPVIRTRFYLSLIEALEMDRDTARACLQSDPTFDMMISLRRAKNRFAAYDFEGRLNSWEDGVEIDWDSFLGEEISVSPPFMNMVTQALNRRKVTGLQLRDALGMSKFKFAGLQNGKLPILNKKTFIKIVYLLSLEPKAAISAALQPWTLENLPTAIPYTPEFRWLVEKRRIAAGHDYQSLSLAMGRQPKYYQKTSDSKKIDRAHLLELLRVLDINQTVAFGFLRSPLVCDPKEANSKCEQRIVTVGDQIVTLIAYPKENSDFLVSDLLLLKAMMRARPEATKSMRSEWAERAAALVFTAFRSELQATPKSQDRILLALQEFVKIFHATEETTKEELRENMRNAAHKALQIARQARLNQPID